MATNRSGDPERRMRISDRRKPGFFQIDNELISVFGADLGPNGIAVYCALCFHSHHSDGMSWPSAPKIAQEIGVSVITVRRMIERLERLQLISVTEAFDSDGQAPNDYLILETPAAVPAGWAEGPRPIRSVHMYGKVTSTPPLPATLRTLPPISQIGPPYLTDRPPLSHGEAPPITRRGRLLTRRNEQNPENTHPRTPSKSSEKTATKERSAVTVRAEMNGIARDLEEKFAGMPAALAEALKTANVQFTQAEVTALEWIADRRAGGVWCASGAQLIRRALEVLSQSGYTYVMQEEPADERSVS